MLERVIGSVIGQNHHREWTISLTELLVKEWSLSVIFLRLSVKTFYERDKNLRGPPILSGDARGYFTVPNGRNL